MMVFNADSASRNIWAKQVLYGGQPYWVQSEEDCPHPPDMIGPTCKEQPDIICHSCFSLVRWERSDE